ncbi:MAG TPA: glucose-6-phosphate isomerase [Gemmataceae bacterium]|nr:glucose-6-phosphate isomerase [Gemmataceae bacterium]
MELPDEAVAYNYQSLLTPVGEEWSAAAELRARHFLAPSRLKDLLPRLMQCRSQVAAEREMRNVPPEMQPLDAGFIDLPQATLDNYRRKGESSDLGRVLNLATRLREQVDRVVFLGAGGSTLGPRALFQALLSRYHNELPPQTRLGVPRLYFEGDDADNDALQNLLDLLQITCVDPEQREERWAVAALSKSGEALEAALALRVFRREASEYYGLRSEWLTELFAAATGSESKLRKLFQAHGHDDANILSIPANVGARYSVFTAAGLLPAAVMGLDVRALLLGAAAMTKRFLEEPFERNPVLQFACINYLMTEECHKPLRVLSVWSKKLEALGWWYDQLASSSLSKQGLGPTPLTMVAPRDLHARGQQHQDGPRDRLINNLIVKNPKSVPILVQMADHNEDELNQYNRKGLPDILKATLAGVNQAYYEAARPTADLVLPTLSEHTMGQLMQMLMLATVVEARLMGVNPYGQPGMEVYKRHRKELLTAETSSNVGKLL